MFSAQLPLKADIACNLTLCLEDRLEVRQSDPRSNSETLRRVLTADLNIHSREPSCWTGQVLDAFQGLRQCDSFVQAMRQGTPISTQEFTDDLRHRLRAV